MNLQGSRKERGQDLAEYALILPIFLLVIFSIFDMGRAVYYYGALQNSVREGARYGIIYPEDITGIENIVRQKAVGLNVNDLNIYTSYPSGDTIQVRATFQFHIVTPIIGALFGTNELTFSGQTTMHIEG
jgi:Flp pilus assembly protein TadG